MTGQWGPGAPRAVIRASWQRCASLVTPSRREVPLAAATEAERHDLRLANEFLLRASGPVLRRLTDYLEGSGYVLGLADARGRLLELAGDRASLRRLEPAGLVPGADWSEAAAGTNGIGTALYLGHGVQVAGPEHFCEGWQGLTCVTALIRHPYTRQVLGALDLSGDYRLVQPFFAGFLAAAALEMTNRLDGRQTPGPGREPPFRLAFFGRGLGLRDRPTPAAAEPWLKPGLDGDLRRQLQQQQRRAQEAERLALAGGSLSASLDLEVTLQQVAEQAARLLDLEGAAALLLDEDGRPDGREAWFSPRPYAGLRRAAAGLLRDETAIATARDSSEPVVLSWPVGGSEAACFTCALLPLQNPRGVMGLIVALRPAVRAWDAGELRLGLALALQAAAALENARLYATLQQHHRHVEAVNTVNQLLSAVPDPAQNLAKILERIVVLLELDAGLALLGGPGSGDLAVAARYEACEARRHEASPVVLAALRQLAELAAERRAPLRLCGRTCAALDQAGLLQRSGLCDVMLAPLAAGGGSLGVLLAGSYHHRQLTGANLTLFASIGHQLSLALKNAQLQRAAGETEALREADQFKNRFLMMVSHDLRSPLTAIAASVEGLLDRQDRRLARGDSQLLHNIADQGRRLARLVDQLLDLSRIEARRLALDRDWTELPALIADAVAKFEGLQGCGSVALKLADNLPLIYVDPDRMVDVLWNLLDNAYRYGPRGVPATVEAGYTDTELRLCVADRGPGIPAAERERVFQYYYRLERDQGSHRRGSGLGLAICRGIVNAHGGRIWVEDRPGGGSRFCLALPASCLASAADLERGDVEALALARRPEAV
ncbi:MAG: GAF domain-containing protein [Anaerolineales bacterium]|nr:GAF domain-containing protein [Anaerolineales bacterium]